MAEVINRSELYEDLTLPRVAGDVDPIIFDRLSSNFPAGEYRSVHVGHAGIIRPEGNDELLNALGDYKDMVISYAEAKRNRRVRTVQYIIDLNVVPPGLQQRPGRWHVDGMQGGMALLAASAIPTEFIVGTPELAGHESEYICANSIDKRYGDLAYDDRAIRTGLDLGRLAIYQPECGQAVELGRRIHRSAVNTTDRVMQRVFITAIVDFKRPSVLKNLFY